MTSALKEALTLSGIRRDLAPVCKTVKTRVMNAARCKSASNVKVPGLSAARCRLEPRMTALKSVAATPVVQSAAFAAQNGSGKKLPRRARTGRYEFPLVEG